MEHYTAEMKPKEMTTLIGKEDNGKEQVEIRHRHLGSLTRKTVAEGLLDVALLLSNGSQLKALLQAGDTYAFYHVVLVFLITSIAIQAVVFILLLVIGALETKDPAQARVHNVLNLVTVALIGSITFANVFITAFGVQFIDDSLYRMSLKNKSDCP